MFVPMLPEPWMIAELDRRRRERESHHEERPSLPLPPPPPPPRNAPSTPRAGRTVVVIDLA